MNHHIVAPLKFQQVLTPPQTSVKASRFCRGFLRANHNDTAKITESLIQKWPTKLSDSYDQEITVDAK